MYRIDADWPRSTCGLNLHYRKKALSGKGKGLLNAHMRILILIYIYSILGIFLKQGIKIIQVLSRGYVKFIAYRLVNKHVQ